MSLQLILASLPDVSRGLLVTLSMWVPGSLLAFAAGLLVAVARHYGGFLVDRPLWAIGVVLRGTPFLIQLFLLYYAGPFVGLTLEPDTAGLVGLTVYGAAYVAETLLGGLRAVPKQHVEAASCTGLTRFQTLHRVLLPEMALLVTPALVNLLVVLLKETAILSIITVQELTNVITGIGSANFAYAEAAFLLAACYWLLTEGTGLAGRFVERRLARFRFA